MKIPFIDRILDKLTYRIKLITSVAFYTLAVMFLTFVQYIWEERLINMIVTEQQGIEYQYRLATILKQMLQEENREGYAFWNAQDQPFDLWVADFKNYILKHSGENYAYQFLGSVKLPDTVPFTHSSFVHTIRKLQVLVTEYFRLLLDIDPQNYYLSFASDDLFPVIQNDLLQIHQQLSKNKNAPVKVLEDQSINMRIQNLANNVPYIERWNELGTALDTALGEDAKKKVIAFIYSYKELNTSLKSRKNADAWLELSHQAALDAFDAQVALIDELKYYLNEQMVSLGYWREVTQGVFRLALAIIIVLYVVRVVRKPLDHLKHAAEQVSNGNLAVRIPITAKDELAYVADQFNQMTDYFEKIIIDARQIMTQLSGTFNIIHDTTKQLEDSTLVQEKTIQQIAGNTKSISTSIQRLASHIHEVNRTASRTSTLAESGYGFLSEIQVIMEQITLTAAQMVEALSFMEEHVRRINEVIHAIIKIADQSNLLSLNTAIRAGKANVQAVGFSVVANKIRELADQTANAILEIESVVEEILENVQCTVYDVSAFSSKIQSHIVAEKALTSKVKEVILHTKKQILAFEDINEGMQEQAKRAQNIYSHLTPLTRNAHHTTESVRRLYGEIDVLHQIVIKLQRLVDRFSIGLKDASAPPSEQS